MKELCKDPWDADYIDKIGEDRQLLYDLILAANYMDIKSLLHLGCAKVPFTHTQARELPAVLHALVIHMCCPCVLLTDVVYACVCDVM